MEPRAADISFAATSPTSHTLEHRSGFQKLQIAPASLSHFRNDFGCWNFLYPKSALNLIATLPMQACCSQERRTCVAFF
jgi:hypothetical protein